MPLVAPLAAAFVAAPLDPTTYGWVGQILALIGMLAALVVLLRWWFTQRRR